MFYHKKRYRVILIRRYECFARNARRGNLLSYENVWQRDLFVLRNATNVRCDFRMLRERYVEN